jgi:antitoxin VapB
MPINIKNERVSQLAVALAEQTGETITDAVGNAIEEKLNAIKKKKSREGIADKIRELSKEFRAQMSPEWLAKTDEEWDEELYDELGLPK